MVYRQYHEECNEDCTRLVAYVRIDGKWTRIGHYGSECKQFEPLDLQKEEQEQLQKEKHNSIKSQLRKIKAESRDRRKTIENELNMTNSFFKEQTKSYQSDSK
ncbi:hypothetical protein [Nitrosopumilus maritimus]|uniref:Uncharacterized protein n=1 Tax=Nitrosopumilus maritimus (strain SCM1) TaxID=436308 RepID=A9A2N1_NITMS|nr:hypothetical protein [Nitrosopumilus maritimus]ABX13270.1 hypothetical protein Nmar_1374 [Nitrosopumilus maritimus SCM1]